MADTPEMQARRGASGFLATSAVLGIVLIAYMCVLPNLSSQGVGRAFLAICIAGVACNAAAMATKRKGFATAAALVYLAGIFTVPCSLLCLAARFGRWGRGKARGESADGVTSKDITNAAVAVAAAMTFNAILGDDSGEDFDAPEIDFSEKAQELGTTTEKYRDVFNYWYYQNP